MNITKPDTPIHLAGSFCNDTICNTELVLLYRNRNKNLETLISKKDIAYEIKGHDEGTGHSHFMFLLNR
jgi:hypothetical protein